MISLCTVVDTKHHHEYYKLFAKSLLAKSRLVTHVYVALIDDSGTGTRDYTELVDGVQFHYFDLHVSRTPHWISYKHAIGLHKCLERVETPYTIFSDCDILFLRPRFDEFCVQLFEENKLNIVGTQMYKIAAQPGYQWCAGPFPFIHFCLMRTATLPTERMFRIEVLQDDQIIGCNKPVDRTLVDDYYLTCGCVPEYKHIYPFPDANYDTGCKLYIWNHQNKGRWVSFGPGWRYAELTHWYSNVQDIVLPPNDYKYLLYHQGNSIRKDGKLEGNRREEFRRAYWQSFMPLA